MYIPEFLCGVLATLLLEAGVLILYGIYLNTKNK